MRALGCALVLLAVGSTARADSRIDGIEHLFGATNVHAITGHGGLSLGVSADGDATVLTWPSPSYADQLAYISSNAVTARSLPRFGAAEGAGAFLGLVIDRAGARSVSWLRDRAEWTITQSYGDDDGPNVVTTHVSARLGLTVRVVDAVHPQRDVWVRHVRVERAATSPVEAAWLLTYANLSPLPAASRIPELPLADWAYDGRNDFGALFDPDAGEVVCFHPGDQRIYDQPADLLEAVSVAYGPLGDQLAAGTPSEADARALLASLDADYAPGAVLLLGTEPPPDQHQVGFDATPLCDSVDEIADNLASLVEMFPDEVLPIDPSVTELLRCDRSVPPARDSLGWAHAAEDALLDAADGELSGSPIAAEEVNEALRTPLAFDASGVAEASVYVAAGATLAEARAARDGAGPPAGVPAAAEAALSTWLAEVRLPTIGSDRVRQVARRSLINLRVGTDRGTGAIVASISRQPPYGLDWPRDGAFFDVALDVSGQSELVGRRAALYGSWQRDAPVTPTLLVDPDPPPPPSGGRARDYPADAWEMNYYADGVVGGLFRFEIDNTAFALWSIVAHAGWEEDPDAYLAERWDTIVRAAELLVSWRDPETGLHWPAQEDDNAGYSSTLHGAVPVYGAMAMATRAAQRRGDDERARRWAARARELRAGIVDHLYDEAAGRFVTRVDERAVAGERGPTGTTGWLVWPARVLPWDDPRVESQLESDLGFVTPDIRLENEGGAYFMKNTVAFALTLGQAPDRRAEILDLLERLAVDHATDTGHFGEAMVTGIAGGVPTASQRVAPPHLWEGILFYLTAMAMEDPAALVAYDEVLPPLDLAPPPPTPIEDGSTGCACEATAPRSGGIGALTGALAWAIVRRRRASRRAAR